MAQPDVLQVRSAFYRLNFYRQQLYRYNYGFYIFLYNNSLKRSKSKLFYNVFDNLVTVLRYKSVKVALNYDKSNINAAFLSHYYNNKGLL